jgi:hypothetical protein
MLILCHKKRPSRRKLLVNEKILKRIKGIRNNSSMTFLQHQRKCRRAKCRLHVPPLQILFHLTIHSYTFNKSRFTIRRYRFFDSCKTEKQNYNLPRNIRGFGLESILIIISSRLKHSEKKEMDYRLYTLIEAGTSLYTPVPWPWRELLRLL